MERGQTLLKTGRAAVNSQKKLALKLGRRKDGSEMMTGGGGSGGAKGEREREWQVQMLALA